MDIKIDIKNITKSTKGFSEEILKTTLNETAKAVKIKLDKALKKEECETHKNKTKGTITIIPNLNTKKIEYKFSNFCCKDFKDRIKL